jgi:hypothetical protein
MSKELSNEASELIKAYDLDPETDVFISRNYKIITRQGIDKIIGKANIKIIELDPIFIDPFEVVYKGIYEDTKGNRITTTGSASVDRVTVLMMSKSIKDEEGDKTMTKPHVELLKKGNVMQNPPYLSEMAEKRCNSRGVLKLAGFYDQGFYGEDEAEDFGKAVKAHRSGVKSEII